MKITEYAVEELLEKVTEQEKRIASLEETIQKLIKAGGPSS